MDRHEERLKEFQEKSDDDLLMTIEISPNTPNADLANAILQNRLKKSIVELRETSRRQTNWLIGLTIIIAVLTFLMLAGLGVQVWLALK